MNNLDDIKRKLRGILAKAEEGSGTTDAEAQAALDFARRLMLRHQLTDADLGQDRKRTPSEIAADTEYGTVDAFTTGGKLSKWEWGVACAINGLIGTTQTYRTGPAERRSESGNLEFDATGQTKKAVKLVFYGPAEDCRDARVLFDEWVVLIAALARMKFGGALRGSGRSYAEGFAAALLDKVHQMRKRERALLEAGGNAKISMADAALVAANEVEDGSDCTALVVAAGTEIMLAKKEQGSAWLTKEKGIELRKSSGGSGGEHDHSAFAAGEHDGQSADFSRTSTKKIQ